MSHKEVPWVCAMVVVTNAQVNLQIIHSYKPYPHGHTIYSTVHDEKHFIPRLDQGKQVEDEDEEVEEYGGGMFQLADATCLTPGAGSGPPPPPLLCWQPALPLAPPHTIPHSLHHHPFLPL